MKLTMQEDQEDPIDALEAPLAETPKDQEYYDKVRQRAYLNWLAATGGNTLSEDPEGLRFWLQAEEEIATEAQS